ncbi:hypothetical protein PIB30_044648 [Stylosanthes scabra]|uniref:RRM domain-containing protein n=1 Tax=Stylosanthes scabra TaxID=79078 RepID=A0ABU6XHJ7_9FABA|nr:hypothetical protein [Stylosanthes scabra]
MGAKAKKAMKKSLKKATAATNSSSPSIIKSDGPDYLPLEGGPARNLPEQKPLESAATVLYIGRIPHGFYEKEMEGFFGQFGNIKRLRIARNKKTGKSRHFGFVEFQSPEVAKVVAETMHNYLLFEHLLQVHLIPAEEVHPQLWRGFSHKHRPVDSVQVERVRHDKERTLEEYNKLVGKIMKRDNKRRKRMEAAGIDYECPAIVGNIQPAPKKIKFED